MVESDEVSSQPPLFQTKKTTIPSATSPKSSPPPPHPPSSFLVSSSALLVFIAHAQETQYPPSSEGPKTEYNI